MLIYTFYIFYIMHTMYVYIYIYLDVLFLFLWHGVLSLMIFILFQKSIFVFLQLDYSDVCITLHENYQSEHLKKSGFYDMWYLDKLFKKSIFILDIRSLHQSAEAFFPPESFHS